jgi:hypothetical protein
MKAAKFRDEIVAALQALAWDQWSQLGVSAGAPRGREERAADVEALLLFTLEIGRTDRRLFDEVLDWLALNEPLISVQRLRNLSSDPTDRALVDSALAWSARVRGRDRAASSAPRTDSIESLFRDIEASPTDLDPSFAQHGFARAPLKRSGKSQSPRLHDPIAFALRLRRLLGVSARAEVIRALLTIRAPRLSTKVITASAGFAQRNVREALTQVYEAGVVARVDLADDRLYEIDHSDWAALLGLPAAPAFPFHYDWIPAFRALTRIARWLQRPGLDDLSPYLLASQARTLVGEIEGDLRYVGVPPALYAAHGADFWDEFVEIVRGSITSAARTAASAA